MIYDCFTFFNELELLDIRLHELTEAVDKFVLVESSVTFTNKKKPFFYKNNKKLFKKFFNKIIHVVVNDSPNTFDNPWIIEMHQFNAITRGLKNCKDDDMILLSCADEIPKSNKIIEWYNKPGKIKTFTQSLNYYFLNYQSLKNNWQGTKMLKYKDLLSFKNPYIARYSPSDVEIPNAGWHFSYIGGADKIREKIFSFSHQEFNNPKYNTPEKINLAMLEGRDLFDRNIHFTIVSKRKLPEYVKKHKHKFSKLFISKQKGTRNLKIKIYFWKILDWLRLSTRSILIYLKIKN